MTFVFDIKLTRGQWNTLTTYLSSGCCGSHWGDILLLFLISRSFSLPFFVFFLFLFYPHISRPITHTHTPPSLLLLPPHTMCKTSNGKIKTTFISRATIGDGEMSHIVTATFFFFCFVSTAWVGWRQLSAGRWWLPAAGDPEQTCFFFKSICGHVVSLSGPGPHAVLDALPTMHPNQNTKLCDWSRSDTGSSGSL